jgi:hypothetical protein
MEQLQGSGNVLARGGYSRGKQVVREKWRIFACAHAGECKFKHIARQRWGYQSTGSGFARSPSRMSGIVHIYCVLYIPNSERVQVLGVEVGARNDMVHLLCSFKVFVLFGGCLPISI